MNNLNHITVDKCPITGDTDRFTYLNLGEMPLVNNLNATREESLSCAKFPLAVQYFKKSKLSCLTYNIDPDLVFSQYAYKSGVAKAYADHCQEGDGSSVLDIGGNDGTLLNAFLQINNNLDVLNVDASENLTKVSSDRGIPTLCAYWGADTAKTLQRKFKLITSTNVFQHTPPIEDFVEAISLSLDKFGVWCLEFPYWKRSMETKQYDQVYHEHVYYYLLEPLRELFGRFGLVIIRVAPQQIHGGSLRLLIAHRDGLGSTLPYDSSVEDSINEEANLTEDYYTNWGASIQDHIVACKDLLHGLKATGKSIVGFGAAAKGCIFLNSAKIDDTVIDCVIDDTDLKQGKFIPGTGIQVRGRDYLTQNKVDYILILAHNFRDVIIEDLKRSYDGNFIALFPKPQII